MPSDETMTTDEAVGFIMNSWNCSRDEAKRLLVRFAVENPKSVIKVQRRYPK